MARNRIVIALLFTCQLAYSQSADSTEVDKKRLRVFVASTGILYTASMASLYYVWYENAEETSFRFFDDSDEWKQMDKYGHFFSAFYLSFGVSRSLMWCNVLDKKAIIWGSVTSFALLLPIEIFDGYSEAYGASGTDLLANAAGASLYFVQAAVWNEVRIHPKFSFQRSNYAQMRPEVLGNNLGKELVKDYNGQTYWMSVDMDKFIRFPKWLNLAFGFGAEGMVYARDAQNIAAGLGKPYRQFYIGLDPDLTALKGRSKFWNTMIDIGNMIKIPGPTLEVSNGKATFHPLHF